MKLEGFIERPIDDIVVNGMFLYSYTHVLSLKEANIN